MGGQNSGRLYRYNARAEMSQRAAITDERPSGREGRTGINLFLVVFLSLVAIDATPSWTMPQRVAKVLAEPILHKAGLWQGTWQLFAPTPDKINTVLSARIWLPDGTMHAFEQPDWSRMSAFERWRYFRHMEYWDSVRLDDNRSAWHDLARYLARHGHPEAQYGVVATRVELRVRWHEVAAPEGVGFWDRVERPPRVWSEYAFFVWEPEE